MKVTITRLYDDYAAAILDKMPELQAHVPSLWPLEVANALIVGERRGRITPADTARFLASYVWFENPMPSDFMPALCSVRSAIKEVERNNLAELPSRVETANG